LWKGFPFIISVGTELDVGKAAPSGDGYFVSFKGNNGWCFSRDFLGSFIDLDFKVLELTSGEDGASIRHPSCLVYDDQNVAARCLGDASSGDDLQSFDCVIVDATEISGAFGFRYDPHIGA